MLTGHWRTHVRRLRTATGETKREGCHSKLAQLLRERGGTSAPRRQPQPTRSWNESQPQPTSWPRRQVTAKQDHLLVPRQPLTPSLQLGAIAGRGKVASWSERNHLFLPSCWADQFQEMEQAWQWQSAEKAGPGGCGEGA